ncbi:MAG: phage major capsid protein [Sterolibacterium sp.]
MIKHTARAAVGLSVSAAALAVAGMGHMPIFMEVSVQDRIAALETRRSELFASLEEITNGLAEGDDLSEEQMEEINDGHEAIEKMDKQIAALKKMAPVSAGRRATDVTNGATTENGGRRVPAAPRANDPRGGFRNFGEFATSVADSVRKSSGVDNRLLAAATTYGNEGTGADGGFAVPPEFRQAIWRKVNSDDNLMTLTDQLETGSNNMTFPKDETTPWQTTGGVQCYWENEGGQVTASKPSLEMSTMRLSKLMALVPVSEELLDDAPGLESWLRSKAPSKMVSKINTAIIDGTGVGQPLGILKSPSLVTVSAETSQTADTIWYPNIVKMWGRLYAPLRRNAVWLINQDVEQSLHQMAFDHAATAGKVPVYLPPNGAAGSPYSTLMGRPVIPVQACKTLGDAGDIILTDLSQYMTLKKAGQDIKTDVSMHLYFDQALQAFRFIFRVNGQPWWGSYITPQNSANTLSWAVALAAR